MAALTLAGHETTANTLTWLLWELAKHPHIQDRLREEIREKREEISLRDFRGNEDDEDADFRMDDLEGMPFLQALLKVRVSERSCWRVTDAIELYRFPGGPSLPPDRVPSRKAGGKGRRHPAL